METHVINQFEQKFNAKIERLTSDKKQLILRHFGSFKEDLIYRISETIEHDLLKLGFSYTVVKKVFSSVTEAINNIVKHGVKAELSVGIVIVYVENKKAKVIVSNIVESKLIPSISSTITEINQLTQRETEERFYELMKRSIVSNTSSLGIGFLSIRMNSTASLYLSFDELNEQLSVFSLEFETQN